MYNVELMAKLPTGSFFIDNKGKRFFELMKNEAINIEFFKAILYINLQK